MNTDPTSSPYRDPEEIAILLLTRCCETLEQAIKAREDVDKLISKEQVQWVLPNGRGWINFPNDNWIRIQGGDCGDICYGGPDTPQEVKKLTERAYRLLQRWQRIKAAVGFSKLF